MNRNVQIITNCILSIKYGTSEQKLTSNIYTHICLSQWANVLLSFRHGAYWQYNFSFVWDLNTFWTMNTMLYIIHAYTMDSHVTANIEENSVVKITFQQKSEIDQTVWCGDIMPFA